jgi:ferredoxin/flavodoxin---NADP+ reductase
MGLNIPDLYFMNSFPLHKMKKVSILSNCKISNSAAIIRFKRSFDFTAGQIINITTDKSIPPRMYSILSSERDENVEILYKIVPEGNLTPKLNLLEAGYEIYISEPSGKFTATYDPAWLIATGTGIAPFISMLFSGYCSNKKLIHGNRFSHDLYYSTQLIEMMSDNYIPCCSGEANDNLFYGRVTDYINCLVTLPENNKYYLCGSSEMVVETRDLLIDKGVPIKNILSEIYF